MNRITQKFQELRRRKKKAFIGFLTAGDPSLQVTEQLVLSFEKVGVDIIELGVPFSDPLADGKTIQAASERALAQHVTLDKILQLVKRLRAHSQIPIALMTYYNPIFHFGEEKFISNAQEAGVDGIIIPDLPPEEASVLIRASRAKKIATIFFLSPTTDKERIKRIATASRGFIYYVSMTGVTGTAQMIFTDEIKKQIELARKLTQKPICVGFGVSTLSDIRAILEIADGVIVGSAIIKEIVRHKGKKNIVRNVSRFVGQLAKVV